MALHDTRFILRGRYITWSKAMQLRTATPKGNEHGRVTSFITCCSEDTSLVFTLVFSFDADDELSIATVIHPKVHMFHHDTTGFVTSAQIWLCLPN